MKELEYPFDAELILKRSKRLKKELLSDASARIKKKIAVLGGSTTHDIVRALELFLLHHGVEPSFYESEYAKYWEDAMFPPEELRAFQPDLVFVHTSTRNLTTEPEMTDDEQTIEEKLAAEIDRFEKLWDAIKETHACPIIQNNFEMPTERLLGNRDAYDPRGKVYFVREMNARFAAYARTHEGFYLNDVAYLSACYGLDRWADPAYWYMYKYALSLNAIPLFAHNLANIIKSIFGKNKKALVLDLDNTLWGGVVGDDGVEGLVVGEETAEAEAYTAFQRYLKRQKEIGVALNIASKNDEENALAGLAHPDGVLKKDDFVYIRANWEPKSENVKAIAEGLNILPDAVVFVDDNPAEREIVTAQVAGVVAPAIDQPELSVRTLDRSGFFEVTNLTTDDLKRVEMYRENMERKELQARFTDYHDYLLSLEMTAEIAPFQPLYYERIAQLTNKSNQYNLTTKRCTVDEIKRAAADKNRITLYGRLADKFGDNGVVALAIARIDANRPDEDAATEDALYAHIELWLMSCRVLKRDMEFAMMDEMIARCKARGVKTVFGYYYPTAKNKMVEDFYALQGFTKIKETPEEATARFSTVWRYDIPEPYEKKNTVIKIAQGAAQKGGTE